MKLVDLNILLYVVNEISFIMLGSSRGGNRP
jgi:hypothetical protein